MVRDAEARRLHRPGEGARHRPQGPLLRRPGAGLVRAVAAAHAGDLFQAGASPRGPRVRRPQRRGGRSPSRPDPGDRCAATVDAIRRERRPRRAATRAAVKVFTDDHRRSSRRPTPRRSPRRGLLLSATRPRGRAGPLGGWTGVDLAQLDPDAAAASTSRPTPPAPRWRSSQRPIRTATGRRRGRPVHRHRRPRARCCVGSAADGRRRAGALGRRGRHRRLQPRLRDDPGHLRRLRETGRARAASPRTGARTRPAVYVA